MRRADEFSGVKLPTPYPACSSANTHRLRANMARLGTAPLFLLSLCGGPVRRRAHRGRSPGGPGGSMPPAKERPRRGQDALGGNLPPLGACFAGRGSREAGEGEARPGEAAG